MLQLSYINSVKLHSYLSKMNPKLNFRPVQNWVAVRWETVSTFALVKHADVSNFCLVDIESDKVIFHGHVVFNRVLHTKSFSNFSLLYFDKLKHSFSFVLFSVW